MKKFGFFVVALAAIMFTACNNGGGSNDPTPGNLPSGFYLAQKGVAMVAADAMDQGINEVDQTARDGMYEKYAVLEANKEYEFINKFGEKTQGFGAALEYGEDIIITDNHEIAGYKASLTQGTSFKVKETGLYHIVLDFDKDGKLADVGGAQCVVVPVEWGIAGNFNSWGFEALTANGNKYEIKGFKCETAGGFKFKHNECWKINLDIANLVKANTNIGKESVPGGDNIDIELGVYDITLEFVGPAKTTAESFTYTVTKTGDVEIKDYSNCELELVGDAVADQEGAVADASSWGWGNTLSLGLPEASGEVYTWVRTNVKLLAAGGFKARTPGAQAQGEIGAFDFGVNGGNATVEADGLYTVIATVNAKTSETTLQMFDASVKGITVSATVPAGWAKCYLWAWEDGDKNVFSAWPGKELTIEGGKVSYTFLPTVEKVNVIFSNGDGAQTNDIKDITADQEIDIAANLK